MQWWPGNPLPLKDTSTGPGGAAWQGGHGAVADLEVSHKGVIDCRNLRVALSLSAPIRYAPLPTSDWRALICLFSEQLLSVPHVP